MLLFELVLAVSVFWLLFFFFLPRHISSAPCAPLRSSAPLRPAGGVERAHQGDDRKTHVRKEKRNRIGKKRRKVSESGL